ncbi:hypothetical protein [Vineibacter terrae]|uniref:hypothetical protein n=1 Tax=Vineibacter terrae TaxID=2586908 RepID=UPI002E324652|nr:hypothetical protein [Vineibacter terrae]HEX2884950.1 hypothetical protein [Vineibacter terrae]
MTTNSDAYFDEQFPLSAIDDFMIHQTADPIRVVASTDPRFFERYWCICHDDVGELLVVTGGSFYPNLDTAEAFAIVNHQGQHRSVRAFRRLGSDRMDLRVGPLHPQILRGMREWRLTLAENDWGISFDLLWRDTRRQIYHAAYSPLDRSTRGRQREVTAGFEGFGTAVGWVTVGGRRIDVSSGSFHGTRDRHWGIGRGVGGPAMQMGRRHKAGWIGGNWIELADAAIWGNTVLRKFGDPRPGMGKVAHVERRLRFEEATRIFTEGEIDYTLDDGVCKRVRFERLGFQTAYMRCGMYGGTPEGNIFHGMYVGDDVVEGDHYDVTRAEVRSGLIGLDEHHCRIICDGETTTGILQPLEPDAYEACRDGKPGWSFL